jgi:hypothetical protein
MRITTWGLGLVFGAFVAGAFLLAGGIALILLAPALVWAARERLRPAGLAGLLIGVGVGSAGLITLSQGNCLRINAGSTGGLIQSCTGPDLTGFYVVAAVLTLGGLVLAAATRRQASRSG